VVVWEGVVYQMLFFELIACQELLTVIHICLILHHVNSVKEADVRDRGEVFSHLRQVYKLWQALLLGVLHYFETSVA
jgi:hypothetical protein